MGIGEKIKLYRNFRGLSQESLAKSINMNPNNYAKIEQGVTNPTYEHLEIIAKELKISVLDLISFDEKRMVNIVGQHNEQISQLINVVNGINNYLDMENERKALQGHIETLKKELDKKDDMINNQQNIIDKLLNK